MEVIKISLKIINKPSSEVSNTNQIEHFFMKFLPTKQVKNGSIFCKGLATEAKKFLTKTFLIYFLMIFGTKVNFTTNTRENFLCV